MHKNQQEAIHFSGKRSKQPRNPSWTYTQFSQSCRYQNKQIEQNPEKIGNIKNILPVALQKVFTLAYKGYANANGTKTLSIKK